MGLPRTNLVTNHSRELWSQWKARDCQPNYRRGVLPDPRRSCGPYRPRSAVMEVAEAPPGTFGRENHDTIAMIAIDGEGAMAAGTSTNGVTHKVPGRIADSGIPGSGAYADSRVGGCGATGDGDVMMRSVGPSRRSRAHPSIHPSGAAMTSLWTTLSSSADILSLSVSLSLTQVCSLLPGGGVYAAGPESEGGGG